jgi:hypothetical protein
MRLRSAVVSAFLAVTCFAAQAQTVWKCQEGSRVVFSDAPCPSTGKPIAAQRLQGNTMKAEPVRPPQKAGDGYDNGGSANAGVMSTGSTNSCPTEQEINNMEVSANSKTRSRQDVAVRQDEIRRAKQCRAGQGNYKSADWQASQDAQRDLSSVDAKRRKAAEARIEGIHSAADPVEGDPIAKKKRDEDEARRLAAEAMARNSRNSIVACDQGGCTSSDGSRFTRTGTSTLFIGPRGACTLVGTQMNCP